MEDLIPMAHLCLVLIAMLLMALFIKVSIGAYDNKSDKQTLKVDGLKSEDNWYTLKSAEENAKAATASQKAAEASLKEEELRHERIRQQSKS